MNIVVVLSHDRKIMLQQRQIIMRQIKKKIPLVYDCALVGDRRNEKENLKNDCTIPARSRTNGRFFSGIFSKKEEGWNL